MQSARLRTRGRGTDHVAGRPAHWPRVARARDASGAAAAWTAEEAVFGAPRRSAGTSACRPWRRVPIPRTRQRPHCAITASSGAGRPTSRRPTTGWWRPGHGRAGSSGSGAPSRLMARRSTAMSSRPVATRRCRSCGRCALLALEPGSRIVVEPGGEARVTHHEGFPFAPGLETVAWPGSAAALDVVRDVRARQAAKVYLDARSLTKVAAHAADGSELRFAWDRVSHRRSGSGSTTVVGRPGIAPPGCDRADDVRG